MSQHNGTPMINEQRQPVKLVKVSDASPVPADQAATAPAVSAEQAERRRIRRVRLAGLRAVVRHERTRTAYRVTVRHGAYVAGGARILTRRVWDARTPARYERMIRAAEAGGHDDEIKEWERRGYAFRAARHRRRMDIVSVMLDGPRALASAAGATAGFLLAMGCVIAWARHDLSYVLGPLNGVVQLLGWLGVIVSVVWGPLTVLLPFAALAGMWAVGRNRQTAPQWALPDDATGRDVIPDEGAILNALRHLNIPALNRAFKEGWQPRWVSGTGRLGNGWHTQLLLPLGVTVEMINGRKKVLAHNLLRLPVEVWPTEPQSQPGVLDLWVADKGSLSAPYRPGRS
ncbi:hypothetical protein [Streptomyces sp. BH105]|uniref:hypothetical protein n=1 Tax=Streptomyces sp. BH105 TaxID=3410408 RepID=UPI003CF7FCC7